MIKFNQNIQEFSDDWSNSFDVFQEMIESESFSEVKKLFNSNPIHPLTILGRLDMSLIFEKKKKMIDSMERILNYIDYPFPNNYFDLPTNDPIGQIMLKPLIEYPIKVDSIMDNDIQNKINWILVGYSYLFKCYLYQGESAYDSLRTLGSSIESNSDHFAFLIFNSYLGFDDYSVAYSKYLVFMFYESAIGFKNHGNNLIQFNELNNEAIRYSNWLKNKNQDGDFSTFYREGKIISQNLFNKIIKDISSKEIDLKKLKVPNLE